MIEKTVRPVAGSGPRMASERPRRTVGSSGSGSAAGEPAGGDGQEREHARAFGEQRAQAPERANHRCRRERRRSSRSARRRARRARPAVRPARSGGSGSRGARVARMARSGRVPRLCACGSETSKSTAPTARARAGRSAPRSTSGSAPSTSIFSSSIRSSAVAAAVLVERYRRRLRRPCRCDRRRRLERVRQLGAAERVPRVVAGRRRRSASTVSRLGEDGGLDATSTLSKPVQRDVARRRRALSGVGLERVDAAARRRRASRRGARRGRCCRRRRARCRPAAARCSQKRVSAIS